MAITSIDIDKELLAAAKELLGADSNREAVQIALEYAVTMHRQRAAFNRIASRQFEDDQIAAPKIDY